MNDDENIKASTFAEKKLHSQNNTLFDIWYIMTNRWFQTTRNFHTSPFATILFFRVSSGKNEFEKR